jgi:hypothetical protein
MQYLCFLSVKQVFEFLKITKTISIIRMLIQEWQVQENIWLCSENNRFIVNATTLSNRYPRASSWFFTIQASLDLKLGKNNLKNEMNTSPLHSPTCKHVVLCPSGFQ